MMRSKKLHYAVYVTNSINKLTENLNLVDKPTDDDFSGNYETSSTSQEIESTKM